MPEVQTARLLWVAFIISQFLFGLVLHFAVIDPTEPDWMVIGVLGAVGVLEGIVGLVGVPTFFKSQPAQTAWIIRWALFEAMTLMGFTGVFLGAPFSLFYAFLALSMVCMALTRPTEDAYTAWEMRRLQ